jgi:hypothetical protein
MSFTFTAIGNTRTEYNFSCQFHAWKLLGVCVWGGGGALIAVSSLDCGLVRDPTAVLFSFNIFKCLWFIFTILSPGEHKFKKKSRGYLRILGVNRVT